MLCVAMLLCMECSDVVVIDLTASHPPHGAPRYPQLVAVPGEHLGERPQLRRDDRLELGRVQLHLDQPGAQGLRQQHTGSE